MALILRKLLVNVATSPIALMVLERIIALAIEGRTRKKGKLTK